MNSQPPHQPPDKVAVDPPPRRKRLRHGWSEASNPHERIFKAIGWITLGLVVMTIAYLALRSLGVLTLTQ